LNSDRDGGGKKLLKLLVADDEQLERKALRQIIESQMPVIEVAGEARNGDEAVDLALELEPQIILLDIKMPGKSGLVAAEEIKKMLPKTRLVMLTAFDYFEYAQTALKLGAVDYLLKPIRPRELLKVLEQVVVEIREEISALEENKRVREKLA
jgi:two-component system response regulator YesN